MRKLKRKIAQETQTLGGMLKFYFKKDSQSQNKMRMSHQSNHKGQIKKENTIKEKKDWNI